MAPFDARAASGYAVRMGRLLLVVSVLALASACGGKPCGNGTVDKGEACDEGAANGTYGHCRADCSEQPALVKVQGDILPFTTEVAGKRVSGAKVSVLEHPEMTVTTGDDAHFVFEGIEVGSDLTLVVEHPAYKPTQTGTVKVGPKGIDPFPIQVVSLELFDLLASLMPQAPQEQFFCAIATTVARFGGSLYVTPRQGLPDVQVTLEPAARKESGPIYFNEAVIPDRTMMGTSIDGGVLYYRVPPGDYVLTAHKTGFVFAPVRFKCREGWVVNAGPPMGPVANVASPDHGLGTDRPADGYSEASDAFCEATSRCVNEREKATNYPLVTIGSCRAMFRNVWAFVNEPCDAQSKVRDAAKAMYACRTSSCQKLFGYDTECVDEEKAFRAAEVVYGACVSK